MKVLLTMSMVVDTDELPGGQFNRLCERFKNIHENLSVSYTNERAWWSMEEIPEVEKRIDLRES